jgi:hypothetical protein
MRWKIVGTCVRCKREVVARIDWYNTPKDERKHHLASYTAGPISRGLCNTCGSFLYQIKAGTRPGLSETAELIDYPRKTMSLKDFAEEYTLLKEQQLSDYQIADMLGMVKKTARWPSDLLGHLKKKIKRAEEAGLL